MKKLLLLSALFIFACSSDDSSNDNNAETFLERYDGVVWEFVQDDDEIGDFDWIMFTNQPQGWIEKGGNYITNEDPYCSTKEIGVPFQGFDFSIIENSENRFSYEATNNAETFIGVLEVSEDGNTFIVSYTDNDTISTATRTDMAQISCN
jgi:hypothetical protein